MLAMFAVGASSLLWMAVLAAPQRRASLTTS